MEADWWKLVWFPLAIPKQAFIFWLVMHDRLLTGDHLIKRGYKGDVKCVYCHNQTESREHLFLECNFSYRIWKFFMCRCNVTSPSIHWDEIIQEGTSSWSSKSLKCMLCRLVLGFVVYHILCTRNEIQHFGHSLTEEQLLRRILWEVRARILGKGKFPKTRENLLLVSLWNLLVDVLI
jgi:hypothetical protein